uniref:Uncharacterized protein n=2 Tax=Aegilops tauschii subsp. strangulata TaxID=200361 RepID=A0A453MQ43_AEGTS
MMALILLLTHIIRSCHFKMVTIWSTFGQYSAVFNINEIIIQLQSMIVCVAHYLFSPVGSTKWLRTDARRTTAGLDESLECCLENNMSKTGLDGHSRLSLFDGNVLQLNESHLVKQKISDLVQWRSLVGANLSPMAPPAQKKFSVYSLVLGLFVH